MKCRTWKKWLSALLMFVMVFGVMACGAPKNDVVSSEVNQSETETVTDVAESEPAETKEQASTESKVEESVVESESVEEEETIAIKDVFGEHNMKAGVCLSEFMVRDKKHTNFITSNFNSVTFENHLKPDYVLDQAASKSAGDIVVKFSSTTETLLRWCKNNNMAMRGHTLVWYSQTPNWIFYEDFDTSKALVSRDVMLARMESYISQVFTLLEEKGYIELFYAYDVVNEAWMEDGSMRDCLWKKVVGDDYLWYAFYYANKYAPEYIDLYYNDYNEQFKTDTLYNFIQTLVDENGNYLIDGIGFQAHLYTEDSLEDYFTTMDKIATLGIKINLTELDVCLGSWPVIKQPTEANLKAQGQFYYNLVNGIFERVDAGQVTMDALTIWGYTDTLSWRRERSPLLVNGQLKPKYAYYGVLQMKELAGFDEE